MKNPAKKDRKPRVNENGPTIMDKILAAFNDAKTRLFAGEEMHVHFSEGNTKTHMPSVDLLPLITCHGRCRKCCGEIKPGKKLPPCYACRIVNRFPDTMKNYAENTVLAMYRPAQYWAEVKAKMQLCRFMRLFVSGDMIIRGYCENLFQALQENPHCRVQGFTKCYEILDRCITQYGKPENLVILESAWGDMWPENPHNLPVSNMYEGEKPESWLTCGGNCAECICVGLGCWKAQAGDIVGFKKH